MCLICRMVCLIFLALLSISFSLLYAQGIITLPQTGQKDCYDSSGNKINCLGTGQDGEIRVGVDWPEPRFEVKGDCIIDNLTGLMWTKSGNLPRYPFVWDVALNYISLLNKSGGLCGYTDWRLPNILELESILNRGEANIVNYLENQGFLHIQDKYWSSTNSVEWESDAYKLLSLDTSIFTERKSHTHYFWPVRGGQQNYPDPKYPANLWKTGQTDSYGTGDDGDLRWGIAWPNPRFIDNKDGTITDNLTGLMWILDGNTPGPISCNPNALKTWQEALDHIKCLNTNNYLGYSDWRLPNIKELLSLIDYNGLFSISSFDLWSSTSVASMPTHAWVVGGNYLFTLGELMSLEKSLFKLNVLPVRGAHLGLGVLKGNVTNLSNNIFINNVTITVNDKASKTNDLGYYTLRLNPGIYDVKFSNDSFETYTVKNVVIDEGKETILSVQLQPIETVSTPDTPSGYTIGMVGISITFSVSGSTSSLGHPVEYQFDWGDGTLSEWSGTGIKNKTWHVLGTFNVKARARCVYDPSIVSEWSKELSVSIFPYEVISPPEIPSGPTNGIINTTYTYTIGGAYSNLKHLVQYLLDWGDGTDSGWLSESIRHASKSWNSPGNFLVRAKARCAQDTSVESDWSPSLMVTISASITIISPLNNVNFSACSLYSLPTFSWIPGEPFKSYEIQFSSDQNFNAIPIKIKSFTNEKTVELNKWKKVLLISGVSGGTIYWRVMGIRSNKTTAFSPIHSIIIDPPSVVENPSISFTSKSTLPTLSWNNKCNTKFKVWFGSDEIFSKRIAFVFNIMNPNENGGIFTSLLTDAQWMKVRKLVGDITGSSIYWYIESWDGLKRYSRTEIMGFTLKD